MLARKLLKNFQQLVRAIEGLVRMSQEYFICERVPRIYGDWISRIVNYEEHRGSWIEKLMRGS